MKALYKFARFYLLMDVLFIYNKRLNIHEALQHSWLAGGPSGLHVQDSIHPIQKDTKQKLTEIRMSHYFTLYFAYSVNFLGKIIFSISCNTVEETTTLWIK